MKLLIVEDNAAMRRLIHAMVADLAELIVECVDGNEVLSAYLAADFTDTDWVLMDVDLPTLDGLQAMQELKAQCPDARVIMVTGLKDTRLRAEAERIGANGFVQKEDLLALRQLLR